MHAIKESSFYFFTGSILTTIITSIDNIVISHYVGVSFVFIYAIIFKLFYVASAALPIATASWPIISSLYQNGDRSELRNFYPNVLRLNVLSKVPLFIAVAIFSKEIISILVGSDNFYGYALVIIFLLTWTLWVWNGSNMVFINAMSLHKLVQLPLALEAMTNLTISILLVKYTSLGIVGVAIGTLIGQMLVAVHYVPRILARQIDIKPFKELSKTIVPLLIPFALLFGLKIVIDCIFTVTFVKYCLYIMSVVFYFMVLYLVVLKVSERQMIKEKIMNIPDGVAKWRNNRR
jgi:O-antigen/teichoic acid export membrane protein